jgi:hypothetical protein
MIPNAARWQEIEAGLYEWTGEGSGHGRLGGSYHPA